MKSSSETGTHKNSGAARYFANVLTLARIAVSPLVFWLVLDNRENLGASWALFGLAFGVAVSDLLDGYMARKYRAESVWGAFFDPLADKIIVLGCALCFLSVDRYWWLPVLLLWAREVPIGIFRFYHLFKGVMIPASFLAKWKTTLQGLALAAAACPWLETYSVLHVVLIWAAVAVTLQTGAQYLQLWRKAAE